MLEFLGSLDEGTGLSYTMRASHLSSIEEQAEELISRFTLRRIEIQSIDDMPALRDLVGLNWHSKDRFGRKAGKIDEPGWMFSRIRSPRKSCHHLLIEALKAANISISFFSNQSQEIQRHQEEGERERRTLGDNLVVFSMFHARNTSTRASRKVQFYFLCE